SRPERRHCGGAVFRHGGADLYPHDLTPRPITAAKCWHARASLKPTVLIMPFPALVLSHSSPMSSREGSVSSICLPFPRAISAVALLLPFITRDDHGARS